MKLLIITQKVDINDDVLGFMHGWIEEFSRQCERVVAICLEEGKHQLPAKVKVLSLGKENKNFKFFYKLKYLWRFYNYIRRERKNYDYVFVHMNQKYIVLGGLFWRAWKKKISLWYAHGHTPFSLRVAEKLTHLIFTSTKSGCRLKSGKIKVIGQGIDANKLKTQNSKLKIDGMFKIITVGRISPVKDYETLIKAVEILNSGGLKIKVDIIGGAGLPGQEEYFNSLKKIVAEKKLNQTISFLGAIANKDITDYLESAGLFVNTSLTGSLDKAILEAMAAGLPVLTCNEALEEVLGNYRERLMYPKKDAAALAQKIKMIIDLSKEERGKLGKALREIVVSGHSLPRFVEKIIDHLEHYEK